MKKYWIIIVGVLLVVVAAIIVWITGPVRVDWSMTAYLFSADGTVEKSFPITIQGKIRDSKNSEKTADLFLDIALPEDFRYSFVSSDDGNSAWKGTELKEGNPDDLRASTFTYDSATDGGSDCRYVINAERGYFLAYWPEDGSYLVAATDPDVKPADVIAHFQLYFDAWGISDDKATQVDWTMHGILMTAGGEVVENVEFSVQGQIMDLVDDTDTLDICGVFPDTFRFDLPATEPAYYSTEGKVLGTEYFVCSGYSYDRIERHSTPCIFALSLKMETMVIYWQKENMYLVASRNADMNTDDIVAYYTGENQ